MQLYYLLYVSKGLTFSKFTMQLSIKSEFTDRKYASTSAAAKRNFDGIFPERIIPFFRGWEGTGMSEYQNSRILSSQCKRLQVGTL